MQTFTIAIFIFLSIAEIFIVSYLFLTLPFASKRMSCDACEKPINLPAFLFKSKCESCGSRHKYDGYWIIALSLIGNIYLLITTPSWVEFSVSSFILAYLLLIFMIDLRYRYIFHKTTLLGFVFALILATTRNKFLSALLGAIAGFLMMLAFYYLGVLYSKYKNRKHTQAEPLEEALGFGDVTLAGVLGAFLGFGSVFQALFTGIFLAGGMSLLMIIKMLIKKEYTDLFIAYGPYLIIASLPFLFGS